jgi:hypothetical protein
MRTLTLQVNELGGGRLSAVFTFSAGMGGRQGGTGSYSMSGSWNARSGRFHLEPQQWIQHPPGFNWLALDGTLDPRTRRMSGRIPTFGCSNFELGPPGTIAVPSPTQPQPARRPDPMALPTNPNQPDAQFEYWDATMSAPQGQLRESEPIDDVIDWLLKSGFSCMGSAHVRWDPSGSSGSAPDFVRTRERYVIECDGNCSGLRYTPYVDGQVYHFRNTQPAPVMEIKTVWFGGRSFRWEFRRMPNGPPPDVYIHRWTSSGFNSGGNCRAPKAR